MLRVIAGKYGKRIIHQPPLDITRATTDKVREALFSSIQFDIEGSVVLDLFAGSGANAIESVSRGAVKAIAVEKAKEALTVIRANIRDLGITNIDVVSADVLDFLKSARGMKFDFIFMDPPYEEVELYNQALELAMQGKLLKQNGLLILETNKPSALVIPKSLTIQKRRDYGSISIIQIANNN